MRTNIEIDDDLMDKAMSAGPYKTKKDAVEAGLQLLARQAAYREILKWRGKLKWEGDESIDWTVEPADAARTHAPHAAEPAGRYAAVAAAPQRAAPPRRSRPRRWSQRRARRAAFLAAGAAARCGAAATAA